MIVNPDKVNRSLAQGACATPATPLFSQRRFGKMLREAEMFGVMPDMVTSETAYDDDGETGVDMFANPRLDRVDLMRLTGADSVPVPSATPVAEPSATEVNNVLNQQTAD